MDTYTNPLNIQKIGDPYVLKALDGRYYCYPTSDGKAGFKVWRSDNLVDWTDLGHIYKATDKSWGHNRFWAPEVVIFEGRYYMYYTAGWKENNSLRIGVAVSDKPEGPFEDVYDRPMFDFGYAVLDANILFDDDGKKYMYYSMDCSENMRDGVPESHIYGIELSGDILSVKGEPVLLAMPEQAWERKSKERFWNEGPFVLKHNGLYYLMYSANCYADRTYGVGYALSDKPLGKFVKYEHNPVLSSSDSVSGPGHHSVVSVGDEMFMVYHTHTDPAAGGGDRQVCIDRMGFDADGNIWVKGPTDTPQPRLRAEGKG